MHVAGRGRRVSNGWPAAGEIELKVSAKPLSEETPGHRASACMLSRIVVVGASRRLLQFSSIQLSDRLGTKSEHAIATAFFVVLAAG